jgi:hypothetical protein
LPLQSQKEDPGKPGRLTYQFVSEAACFASSIPEGRRKKEEAMPEFAVLPTTERVLAFTLVLCEQTDAIETADFLRSARDSNQ